jgi:hypothetical protein
MRLGSSARQIQAQITTRQERLLARTLNLVQSASATAFLVLLNYPVNALGLWTLDLVAPNVADQTYFNAQGFNTANGNYSSVFTGMLDTSTQYTDFFIFLTSGNIGFSYQVFGYANS